jgi:hypothetical protein
LTKGSREASSSAASVGGIAVGGEEERDVVVLACLHLEHDLHVRVQELLHAREETTTQHNTTNTST